MKSHLISFKFLLALFWFACSPIKAQIILPLKETTIAHERDLEISNLLDSIINKTNIVNGIVCLNKTSITIDTIITGKVKRIAYDSVIVGKFLKKNQKKISSKEFWGVITPSGEGQRFYNQDMYHVWETPSPYIYKLEKNMSATYFFSETLLSPLFLLNESNIANTSLSAESRDILYKTLDERKLAEEFRAQRNREMVAEISIDLLYLILQIMVSSGSQDVHHTKEHHEKHQTGPRNNRNQR